MCMEGYCSAYVYWYLKRFYGMMGDNDERSPVREGEIAKMVIFFRIMHVMLRIQHVLKQLQIVQMCMLLLILMQRVMR